MNGDGGDDKKALFDFGTKTGFVLGGIYAVCCVIAVSSLCAAAIAILEAVL